MKKKKGEQFAMQQLLIKKKQYKRTDLIFQGFILH